MWGAESEVGAAEAQVGDWGAPQKWRPRLRGKQTRVGHMSQACGRGGVALRLGPGEGSSTRAAETPQAPPAGWVLIKGPVTHT